MMSERVLGDQPFKLILTLFLWRFSHLLPPSGEKKRQNNVNAEKHSLFLARKGYLMDAVVTIDLDQLEILAG